METKICSKCKRELPLANFNKSAKSPDGHQYYCKECKASKKKEDYEKLKLLPKLELLATFQPRELIEELRRRGYSGELKCTLTVKV